MRLRARIPAAHSRREGCRGDHGVRPHAVGRHSGAFTRGGRPPHPYRRAGAVMVLSAAQDNRAGSGRDAPGTHRPLPCCRGGSAGCGAVGVDGGGTVRGSPELLPSVGGGGAGLHASAVLVVPLGVGAGDGGRRHRPTAWIAYGDGLLTATVRLEHGQVRRTGAECRVEDSQEGEQRKGVQAATSRGPHCAVGVPHPHLLVCVLRQETPDGGHRRPERSQLPPDSLDAAISGVYGVTRRCVPLTPC